MADIPASTAEKAHCHALDTLGAMFAGAQTEEGRATWAALRRLNGPFRAAGVPENAALLAAALSTACRLTECDDIHIGSCTTPGSVVFPAALAAQSLAPGSGAAMLEGIVAGYHVMATLGIAARGPEVVYGHVWPTYLGAAMTAAATAGKMLGLSEDELRHALAIAATMSAGTSGRIAGDPTSRWLTLGCAVQNGLAAAVGSGSGLRGDESILESAGGALGIDARLVAAGTPVVSALDRTSLKPYCTSRQGLAATEAFLSLLREESIEPASIDSIVVLVPAQYRSMIDRSARPKTKLESRGIRYQLALAALHPDDLYDVERRKLRTADAAVCRIMDRVEVLASDRLGALYPRHWPGGVRLTVGRRTFEREVLSPTGDPDCPMDRARIGRKIDSLSAHLSQRIPVAKLAKYVDENDFRKALRLLFEQAPPDHSPTAGGV